MEEKSLLKVALFCSLIGILILIIISEKITIPLYTIGSINKSLTDKEVKINGEIASIKETPGLLILTVQDSTGKITVIIYDKELAVNKGDYVEIQGTVIEYKNVLEIDAKTIRLI